MQPNIEDYHYEAFGEHIDEILRRYNLTLEEINTLNGTNFKEGDILMQDIYLPPDKVEPIYDDGGRTIEFMPTTEALPPPPTPFDPNQATSDWLSAVYGDEASTFAGQEEAMRQDMLLNAYILMHYTDAWEGQPPTPQKYITVYANTSSEEIALMSARLSGYAQQHFSHVMTANNYPDDLAFIQLATELATLYGMNTIQSGIGIENIHHLGTTAFAYTASLGLDEARQNDQAWDSLEFRRGLNELISLVKQMPTEPILGVSPKPVVDKFKALVKSFEKEYDERSRNRIFVHEYEKERTERIAQQEQRDSLSLPWWIELPVGVVFKPADIAMGLRDVFIFGDPAGIIGLISYLPSEVTERIGKAAHAT